MTQSKAGLIKSGLFPCLQCIYLMPADNLRILLYKPFPLAGADGNAVAAGEVYRVPVDVLDVSRVDEKPLMAQHETVSLQLFADVFQLAADRDFLLCRMNKQVPMIRLDIQYLAREQGINRGLIADHPPKMPRAAFRENVIELRQKGFPVDGLNQKLRCLHMKRARDVLGIRRNENDVDFRISFAQRFGKPCAERVP